jgi:hypothetical protein
VLVAVVLPINLLVAQPADKLFTLLLIVVPIPGALNLVLIVIV